MFFFKHLMDPTQRKYTTLSIRYDEKDKEIRFGDKNLPWIPFQMVSLLMGLANSPILSKCAMVKLAEVIQEKYPKIGQKLLKATYFDDITPGLLFPDAPRGLQKRWARRTNEGVSSLSTGNKHISGTI